MSIVVTHTEIAYENVFKSFISLQIQLIIHKNICISGTEPIYFYILIATFTSRLRLI